MSAGAYTRRLHLAAESPLRSLLVRGALMLGLMFLAWLMLWLARDGLNDNRGTPLGVLDVLYFSVVTVTTLGYGDIVPVSPEARAIVTFGITPLRILVWALLFTTAYEFVLRKSVELMEMERLKKSLKGHAVICGFGVKGRSAVSELIDRGMPKDKIIVIDQSQAGLEAANRMGINFLLGNASSEQLLNDASIKTAAEAIVVPNNDEACVLICLTIRELAPDVKIRAAAREDENIKLIKRSGADTVIAPSVSGGKLLASAASSPISTEMVEELFEHGRGVDIYDKPVSPDHIGHKPREVPELADALILAVRSEAGETIYLRDARHRPLQKGDILIIFTPPSV